MMPIAILAGGFASRLGELSKFLPKCLIKVNGRPFVDWQIELLQAAGYTNFIFCLSYKSELVQNYLGDGSKWNIDIKYSLDGEKQLGTGGAIKKALPLLGDKFAVIYGDSYLPVSYLSIETEFLNSTKQALMTVYKNENLFDASNVHFEDDLLVEYAKGSNNPRMKHIDFGLSYFQASVFENYDDDKNFDLADLCSELSKVGKLDGFLIHERFYEIGSISGINELSNYLGKAMR